MTIIKNKEIIVKKIVKTFLIIFCLFIGISNVLADDSCESGEVYLHWVADDDTTSLPNGGYTSYGSGSYWTNPSVGTGVRAFYVSPPGSKSLLNAYCVQAHVGNAPSEGCYTPVEITNQSGYEDLREALYYVYGSRGWNAKIRKLYSKYFCGGDGTNEKCNNNQYYAYSHVLLAYYYNSSANWWAGLSSTERSNFENFIDDFEDLIDDLDDVPLNFKIFKTSNTSTQDFVFWQEDTESSVCAVIIKRDKVNNKVIKGAKFQLYHDSCSNGNEEGSPHTTKKNGYTKEWKKLKADKDYYVKEVSADDAHHNDNNNTCKKITTSETSCKKNTIYDFPRYYCARIKKVDAEDSSLLLNGSSFSFTFYSTATSSWKTYTGTTEQVSSISRSAKTSKNTTAISKTVPLKGYFIVDMLPYSAKSQTDTKFKETTADGTLLTDINSSTTKYRYWNSTNQTDISVTSDLTEMTHNAAGEYTCPNEATTVTSEASDYKQYACIKVKKTDYYGNLIPGSSFSTTINGTTQTHADNWDGANDGYVTFFTGAVPQASLRSYTVTETAAPDEFRKSQNSVSVTEVLLPENKTAAQAEAECKSVDGKTSAGTKIINTSGTVTAKNDKYLINWIKKREDGTNQNGAEFKVYTTINNQKKYVKAKSSFKSWKDEQGTTKTCYVFDTLENSESAGTTFTSMNTQTNGSTSNGEVCIIGFDTDDAAGTNNNRTYTVEETKPLKYHTFGDSKTKSVTISKNYNGAPIFANPYTNLKVYKTVDGLSTLDQTTINQLKQLKFHIKNSSGTVLKFVLVNGIYEYAGNEIDGPSGTGTEDLQLQSPKGSNAMQFEVHHLNPGTYTVEEVENDGCTTNLGTECKGNGFYKVSASAATVSNAYQSVTEVVLTNIRTELRFTKKDLYGYVKGHENNKVKYETTGEVKAFDDITFKIYIKDGNTKKYLNVSGGTDQGTCDLNNSNNFGAFKEYRFVPSSAGDGSTGTALHTSCGNIKITNLCRGQTYYIEEYDVPVGNVFLSKDNAGNTPTVSITIPNEGNAVTNQNNKVTITNTPTKIIINKKNNNPNEDIHEGTSKKQTATFEVYKCNLTAEHCTQANKIGNAIKFEAKESVGDVQTYKAKLDQNASGGVTSLELTTVGSKGQIVLMYLPDNYKYVVVEKNAPDGYYNVEGALAELEVAISKTASTGTKDKVNYPTQIKFTKDDFRQYYTASDLDKVGSNTKIFDSMTFKLHDKDGNIVNLYRVADGEYRFINKEGVHSGTVTELHTKNGNMKITHLYRNETYYLEETAADTEGNFILPNNRDNSSLNLPSSMRGNKHPIVKYSIGNTVPDSNNPNNIPESLTQLIDNDATRVVFEKRDKKTGELIDDAKNDIYVEDDDYRNVLTTFNIYRCEKSVSHCTTSNGTLMHFEDRTYIKDKNQVDITSDITSVTPPVLAYKYKKLNANGITDLHTDRGVLVVAYLPSKYKYVLHETVAPNGYYNPTGNTEDIEFTVQESSLTNGETYETLTSRVENTPTEIYFTKKDLYNYYDKDDLSKIDSNIKIFDSMDFVLRNKEGKILKLKCSSNYEATGERNEDRCRTGEYRYVPIDDNNTIEKMHTKDGNIKITHLYRDEVYYIEEIKEDTEGNFILPDYLNYSEALPFDHKGHPVVKYILPVNAPTDRLSVTQVMNNIPSRVIFQKRDSKYNYLIPDERATFNVYQCDIDVEKCTPEVGRIINFEERGVITGDQEDPGKQVYKYKKLNASGVTDLHPYLGELILRYLPTKYKYVLVETVSPQGYMLPEGDHAYTYFTVSETKVEVEEIQVPNKPVSLLIRKYAQDGELLEGATFNISKAKNCNTHVLPNKVERLGLITLKTIRDGVYEARPTGDTTLFKTCTDRPDMPCNQINSTLTYPDYETEVFGNSMGDFEKLVNSRNEKINIEAGEALVQYLDYGGCYIIEEVEAPKGYSLPEKEEDRFVMIKITDKEMVFDTYEELVNTPTPFTFFKLDEYNRALDGGKYKLQKLNDKRVYQDVGLTKEVKENGEYYYRVDPNGTDLLMETKDGKATISYLEEGQYRVLEVESPPGYELPKKTMNVVTFFVDNEGRVYGSSIIANKPKTEKKVAAKPQARAQFIITVDTGQKIVKYGMIIGLLLVVITALILVKKAKERSE